MGLRPLFKAIVDWITDFLSSSIVLFVGKIVLAISSFSTMYATMSEFLEDIAIFEKSTAKLLSFIVAFHAFVTPFPPSDFLNIMSMNLGLAFEDRGIRIYEEASKRGVGTWLPL